MRRGCKAAPGLVTKHRNATQDVFDEGLLPLQNMGQASSTAGDAVPSDAATGAPGSACRFVVQPLTTSLKAVRSAAPRLRSSLQPLRVGKILCQCRKVSYWCWRLTLLASGCSSLKVLMPSGRSAGERYIHGCTVLDAFLFGSMRKSI